MLLQKVRNQINHFFRRKINQRNQEKLTNRTMTVISSNCNGAFMLHDLGVRFNSPFVNLYLKPEHFIRYLRDIPFYQVQPLTFIDSDKSYPIGKLADIEIHFMHYHSREDAMQKWTARTARMDLNNLFIIMTDRDGMHSKDLAEFNQLPFKNKVIFTHRPYPEYPAAYYIQGFETQKQVGDLFQYSGWFGKKFYDQFDYVSWFNQK